MLIGTTSPNTSPKNSPGGKKLIPFGELMDMKRELATSGTTVTTEGKLVSMMAPNAPNGPYAGALVSPDGEQWIMIKYWPRGQPPPQPMTQISVTGKAKKVEFRPDAEALENGLTFLPRGYWQNDPHEFIINSYKVTAIGDGIAPFVSLLTARDLPPGAKVSVRDVRIKGIVPSDSSDMLDTSVIVEEYDGGIQAIIAFPPHVNVSSIAPNTSVSIKNLIRRGYYGELVRVPFGLTKDSELEFYELDPSPLDDVPPPLVDEDGNLYVEDDEPATKKKKSDLASGN
jgi:hypothetical protein